MNLTFYRVAPEWSASFDDVHAALAERRFAPCAATQEKSSGWVEQRGEPLAFARQLSTWVWIDVERRLLIIDAGSQARTDDLITALVEALDGERVPGAGPVNIAA